MSDARRKRNPVDPLRMVIVRDMWTGRTNYLGK